MIRRCWMLSMHSCSRRTMSAGLASYCIGRVLTLGKHRGLFDLPMTSRGSLSVPSMFAHAMAVTRALLVFPLLHVSPLNVNDRSGTKRYNSSVSSALMIFLGSYSTKMQGSQCCSHPSIMSVVTAAPSSLIARNTILWCVLKRSSHPSLHVKSRRPNFFA